MHNPSIHKWSSARSLGCVLLPLLLLVVTGCAGTVPAKVETPPSHLFQLNDHDWVDLSDVREIQLHRIDVSNTPGGDPFGIDFWRNGSDNPFVFTFADEPSASAAWKRLVAHLGGSVKEDHWSRPVATSKPVVEAAPPPLPVPQSQSLFQGSMSGPYGALGQGLTELARCRDEKLITDAEYQRGRDSTVAAFNSQVADGGSGFQTGFGQLHSDLAQLDQMKKDHLMSDEQIAAIREKTVARYGLTAGPNQ
jgi:hypothetical protein